MYFADDFFSGLSTDFIFLFDFFPPESSHFEFVIRIPASSLLLLRNSNLRFLSIALPALLRQVPREDNKGFDTKLESSFSLFSAVQKCNNGGRVLAEVGDTLCSHK